MSRAIDDANTMDKAVMSINKCSMANIPGAVVEPMNVKSINRLNLSAIKKPT